MLTALGAATLMAQPVMADQACLRGINLAGAEFGKPGQAYGKGYTYPSAQTVAYFIDKGFKSARLPFLWERLQPRLYKDFNAAEAKRLVQSVDGMRTKGMVVILDPHNYARYNDNLIGSDEVPQSAFTDFWRRLASLFAGRNDVIFGLMNEPYEIGAEDWLSAANSAIAAIRQTGARNLVLVPGTAWTGAHSWFKGDYGTPNASVMLDVADPAGNFAYEVHQYLDTDFSGKNDECSRAADAVKAIGDFSDWLRSNGRRAFLGEFAVPMAAACQPALAQMVSAVEQAPDVWLGWSYWAAGDWWKPDEPLNIQPVKGGDRPQMQTLSQIFGEHATCGR
ncbi:glycoside hydrolase family 5 protein [Neorhizobium lilium]|uniref:Glycoside hydrolase family 5 protein n=1 Tax=Neorhizobium lilium TaxID=2503024 RepID=A0A444LA86_9HYPH|nr:glycoside hydrolase family 5 protein [Neorhizobium lilium]RWX74492.1 glycoside hydrolase family 5 protein [Neorhizobium lilium]